MWVRASRLRQGGQRAAGVHRHECLVRIQLVVQECAKRRLCLRKLLQRWAVAQVMVSGCWCWRLRMGTEPAKAEIVIVELVDDVECDGGGFERHPSPRNLMKHTTKMGYGVLPASDLMFMQNTDKTWHFLVMDVLGNEFSGGKEGCGVICCTIRGCLCRAEAHLPCG